MRVLGIAATLITSRAGTGVLPRVLARECHEYHAVDAATRSRPTAGALDLTREAPTAVAVEPVTTAALRGVFPATSPPGWFAGAGDNRDHAIRSWIPGPSGYLHTVCGRPSAQTGRTVNQPCPDCDKTFARAQQLWWLWGRLIGRP